MHNDTKDGLDKLLYRLWKEQENGNNNPAFDVLEKLIGLMKKGLDFKDYSDVLHQVESVYCDQETALEAEYYTGLEF